MRFDWRCLVSRVDQRRRLVKSQIVSRTLLPASLANRHWRDASGTRLSLKRIHRLLLRRVSRIVVIRIVVARLRSVAWLRVITRLAVVRIAAVEVSVSQSPRFFFNGSFRRLAGFDDPLVGVAGDALHDLVAEVDILAKVLHQHRIADGEQREHDHFGIHAEVRPTIFAEELDRGAERFFHVQPADANIDAPDFVEQ